MIATFNGGPKDGEQIDTVRDLGAPKPPLMLWIESDQGRRLEYERDPDREDKYNFVGYARIISLSHV